MAEFGQKGSLFKKTLSVVRLRGCDSLPFLLQGPGAATA